MMDAKKIVVLCGGLSTERNISFLSGARVCAALRARGHRAVLADLYLGFEEGAEGLPCGSGAAGASQAQTSYSPSATPRGARGSGGTEGAFDPEALFDSLPPIPDYAFDGQAPDLEALRRARKWQSPSLFGRHVLGLCRAADIVFLALHGKNGEDGRVQATFDMLGIPYTGSGHLGSAMAMDKLITKQILSARGIRTPAFRRWEFAARAGEEKERFIRRACAETPLPCVVKTPDGGSSVGVYIVRSEGELEPAIRRCLEYGPVFMTEQYIEGRDFTCGVLCGQALPTVEIVPRTRFYDYANKYAAGATEEICPGRISPALEAEIGAIALQAHEILGLSTYSRSDFMVDADGKVWFIEINTLPGMTRTSLVPQEAAAVGISYEELCERIVEDGLRLRGL